MNAMNAEFRMHDTVALLEDVPAKHFLTGQPLMLRRGQVGTVVMTYDDYRAGRRAWRFRTCS
jgi:hypothetical protein